MYFDLGQILILRERQREREGGREGGRERERDHLDNGGHSLCDSSLAGKKTRHTHREEPLQLSHTHLHVQTGGETEHTITSSPPPYTSSPHTYTPHTLSLSHTHTHPTDVCDMLSLDLCNLARAEDITVSHA